MGPIVPKQSTHTAKFACTHLICRYAGHLHHLNFSQTSTNGSTNKFDMTLSELCIFGCESDDSKPKNDDNENSHLILKQFDIVSIYTSKSNRQHLSQSVVPVSTNALHCFSHLPHIFCLPFVLHLP